MGIAPPACAALQRAAVCRVLQLPSCGDHTLPTDQQGLKVLGVPVGTPPFRAQSSWSRRLMSSAFLLERIPSGPPTLSRHGSSCHFVAGGPRAKLLLAGSQPRRPQTSSLHPTTTGVWQCLCRILKILPTCGAWEQSPLPLWKGGLGFAQCSPDTGPQAHWASWADALKMVHEASSRRGGDHGGALEVEVCTDSRRCRVREAKLCRSA